MASERSRQCNRKFCRVLCKSPAPSWLTPAKRVHCMYTLLLLLLLLYSSPLRQQEFPCFLTTNNTSKMGEGIQIRVYIAVFC